MRWPNCLIGVLVNFLQFKLRAANQNGEAVTEVLFWDGPERGIATYKYEVEKDFENCGCCFTNPIPKV